MKHFLNMSIGVLGGVAFLWAAIAIFVWDVGKLQQARASRDWPQEQGTVNSSGIDDRQREKRPHVVYAYTVAGTPYTSSQISFDLFDKPGGEGRIDTIVARYPLGKQVVVYYDPTEPAVAVLEPEVYSPFLMPLMFGALFFGLGLLILWKTVHPVMVGQLVHQRGTTTDRRLVGAVIVSILVYAILVLVSFDSAVRDTAVKAFGAQPAGMPNILFVLAAQTLLYLPMPWVFWHGMEVTLQALQDGKRISIGYLFTVGHFHPELRRSQLVCLGGLVYFIVVCLVWIAYAAACGI